MLIASNLLRTNGYLGGESAGDIGLAYEFL